MADVEGGAVLLLVISQVNEVRPELRLERHGKFNRFEVVIERHARLVSAVVVEDQAVDAVLLFHEETAIGGQEQDGGAGLAGFWGDEIAEVAVLARDARAVEQVHDVDLILVPHDGSAAGTVDADAVMHTTKKVGRRKSDVVADIILAIARAARRGTMQADAGVVENLGTIVDDRASRPGLAHH